MEPYEIAAAAFGTAMLLVPTVELLRKRTSLLQYLFWASLWGALILIGIVPEFYLTLLHLTQALGMYTPIQFVTTLSILILFVAIYVVSKRITELDDKLNRVVQQIALQDVDEKIPSSREQEQ